MEQFDDNVKFEFRFSVIADSYGEPIFTTMYRKGTAKQIINEFQNLKKIMPDKTIYSQIKHFDNYYPLSFFINLRKKKTKSKKSELN